MRMGKREREMGMGRERKSDREMRRGKGEREMRGKGDAVMGKLEREKGR